MASDADEDGFISKSEAAALMGNDGTDAQWQQFVNKVDTNKNGKVDISEFVAFSMQMGMEQMPQDRFDSQIDELRAKLTGAPMPSRRGPGDDRPGGPAPSAPVPSAPVPSVKSDTPVAVGGAPVMKNEVHEATKTGDPVPTNVSVCTDEEILQADLDRVKVVYDTRKVEI